MFSNYTKKIKSILSKIKKSILLKTGVAGKFVLFLTVIKESIWKLLLLIPLLPKKYQIDPICYQNPPPKFKIEKYLLVWKGVNRNKGKHNYYKINQLHSES